MRIKGLRTFKEVVKFDDGTALITIRKNCYKSGIDFLNEMAEEQRKDFPSVHFLNDKQKVVHFAGRCYAKTWGIEAKIPEGTPIPEGYAECHEPENLY